MIVNNISRIVCRLLSILLVVSSILKIVSFDSYVYNVKLFSDAYFLQTTYFVIYGVSMFICIWEFIVGFLGIISKSCRISLWLIMLTFGAFTLITFINLYFPTPLGPIKDCKCFGDFLHFSPEASLLKNCIFLILSGIGLFPYEKRNIYYHNIYLD